MLACKFLENIKEKALVKNIIKSVRIKGSLMKGRRDLMPPLLTT
jgi:hypothetical protein